MQRTANDSELTVEQILSTARTLYHCGIHKFKIVGGEPTLRNDLPAIIAGLRQIDPTIDLSMVTNGSRLSAQAASYKEAGINRINVSLYTLSRSFFKENVGAPSLMAKVDEGIRAAQALGILGKLNHVFQDHAELDLVLAYATDLGVRVNVLNKIPSIDSDEAMPVSQMMASLSKYPVQDLWTEDDPNSLPVTVMQLRDSAEIEIKHLELGEQSKFRSCHACQVRHKCKEGIFAVRVTPMGMLQPCIVRDDNIIDALRSTPQEVEGFLDAL